MIVAFRLVSRSRTVYGNYLKRAHGEVFAFAEVEFVLKERVAVRFCRELIGTALIAGNAVACAAILGYLIVVVGRSVFGGKFEGHQV